MKITKHCFKVVIRSTDFKERLSEISHKTDRVSNRYSGIAEKKVCMPFDSRFNVFY